MICDSLLTRLPLAGCSGHNYKTNFSGQTAKALNILSRIALIAISVLLLNNVFPTTYFCSAILTCSVINFASFAIGGNEKRSKENLLFEFMITSICAILSALTVTASISCLQASMGVIGTTAGGIFLSIPFEKGAIKEIEINFPVGDEKIITEEQISPHIPCLPLRISDYITAILRDITFGVHTLFSIRTLGCKLLRLRANFSENYSGMIRVS